MDHFIYMAQNFMRFSQKRKERLPSKRAKRQFFWQTSFDLHKLLIQNQEPLVNLFASRKLQKEDVVEIFSNWKELLGEEKSSLKILFEDDALILIDKPTGLICEDRFLPKEFPKKATFVHRLDQNTSGVMIVAKTPEIKEKMIAQFSQNRVKKMYCAILDGVLQEPKGRIESRLSRRSKKMTLFGSSEKGQHALTYFYCLKKIKKATCVLCQPVTGRTHQLRVHFFEKGHPILGDYHYAKSFSYPSHVRRLLLHSLHLECFHPLTKEKIVCDSPLPEEFLQVMGGLSLPAWKNFSFH